MSELLSNNFYYFIIGVCVVYYFYFIGKTFLIEIIDYYHHR